LAYELPVPKSWKIHPVVSVAHLEPYKEDPYKRLDAPPPPGLITDDTGEHEEWEAEQILSQRYNKRRKRDEWLLKWKDYGPENNTWEPVVNLANAPELLDEFRLTQNPLPKPAPSSFPHRILRQGLTPSSSPSPSTELRSLVCFAMVFLLGVRWFSCYTWSQMVFFCLHWERSEDRSFCWNGECQGTIIAA
jgi:hypothetical protein